MPFSCGVGHIWNVSCQYLHFPFLNADEEMNELHFAKLHPSEQVANKLHFQADACFLINNRHLSWYKMGLKGHRKVSWPFSF